jgi:hypothetical protein
MANSEPAAEAAPTATPTVSPGAASIAASGAAGEAAPDALPVPGAATPSAPAEAAPPEPIKDQPSLLSSAEGKPPKTPAPEAETPQTEGSKEPPAAKAKEATDPAKKDATPKQPEAAAAPAPFTLSDLTLPEGMTIEAEGGEKFISLMNNGELSAKDRAQGLVDLHRAELERVHRQANEHQRKTWDDLNASWRDQLRNDPVIGGNRLHTNLSKAKGMIEEHLSPEDATALLRHVDANGMGNYAPFIRMLVNLAERMNVFEDGMLVAPPAAPRPQRGPGNRGWYGNGKDR